MPPACTSMGVDSVFRDDFRTILAIQGSRPVLAANA